MKDTQSLHHVFILLGVSGSGKSAVANGVAQRIGAAFLAGDFLHPRANITKMASG
nr:gluconokinase [Proteus mirabilis]